MRIAMIGQRGLPASWGGVERHVEEIGARLVERGHQVTVYSRPDYGDGRRRHRGMQVRELPTVPSKHLEATLHSGLATLAAVAANADVVHFHAVGPGLFSPLARVRRDCTVVQTIHGFDDRRQKWGVAARLVLRSGVWMSQRVPDAVIGVSEEVASAYRDAGRPVVRHVPNGVTDPATVDARVVRDRYGLTPGRYVLFVGRLVPEKQPDLLVRAFAHVSGDVQLVLAGDASHTERYAAKVRRLAAADERVSMPGWVDQHDLAALYANAGVFVLPSSLEGLPLTALEAAAHGAPMILSDLEPHREIVGTDAPGHRLVDRSDAQALARAINQTLADPHASRAGAARLQRRVLERYSWDRATDATLELYRGARRRIPARS